VGRLQGKVAVITGGTTGIGFAAAKLFVKEGAYVFITGRRQKELDEAVKKIGSNVVGVQGDISELTDLDRVYETIKAKGKKIDIVFANAGVAEFAPLGRITEEHFDKLFSINVKGTLFTVQKALPLMNDHSHRLGREYQRHRCLLGLRCNQGRHPQFRASLVCRIERAPHPLKRPESRPNRNPGYRSTTCRCHRKDCVHHPDGPHWRTR